jgi:hypothetical protein
MVTLYYLIKPNDTLLKTHGHLSWLKPVIWEHPTYDIKGASDPEYTLYMKLLFLASRYETQIVFEQAYPEKKETIQSIQAVLGSPPYTAKTFDTWWTIEYIQSSQNSLEVIDDLSVEALSVLDSRENRVVASWIQRDSEKKKEQDSSETTVPRVKSIQYSMQEIWLHNLVSEDWSPGFPRDLKAYWALRLHSEQVGDPQDFGFDAEQWKEWLLVHSPGFKEWMNFQEGLRKRMKEYDEPASEEKSGDE